MQQKNHSHHSLSEVHQSIDTTKSNKSKWRRTLAFFGPAYLVSVGYMDPGNWATDLQGGSRYGYQLIWVLLMSNLMALLLQNLSARLGIVRGKDLAQANREAFPSFINIPLYILAEIAIAACDLAEVLGMAIGLQLLTGIPLIWGVLLTLLDTFLLLFLQRMGMRKLEAFILALIAIIGISFFVELVLAKPNFSEVASGLVPHIADNTALYIAIGIIGATVMPHNLYLHSALVQTRKIKRDREGIKRALKLNFIDSTIALNLAFLVNAAILILAATVFFKNGHNEIARINDAYLLIDQLLGSKAAPILFAVALIAAGQSSTITGTLAGQIVMEGYLHLRMNPLMRRLFTRLIAIIPAVIVILISGENNVDNLLVFSQVILSIQLGFAIIPLIHFVSDKKTMGEFVAKKHIIAAAWFITIVLIFLNIKMVSDQVIDYFSQSEHLLGKAFIILLSILFIALLLITTIYPWIKKQQLTPTSSLHQEVTTLAPIANNNYQVVAVALEFSQNDNKLLSHSIGQGNKDTTFILIHIVESVSAKIFEHDSDDFETRKDKERLDEYVQQLSNLGFKAEAKLGYGKRVKEIVRLVKENKSEILIIGAHRHRGFKDLLYGETINAVRHDLNIPVLIVNV